MLSADGKPLSRVLIKKEECLNWRGPAVVIDVLRASTTICALLYAGKKEITVFGEKADAIDYYEKRPNLEFFSELEFLPEFRKFGNSPYEALLKSDPDKNAIMVTGAGTKAIAGLMQASDIFIGCFANFSAVCDCVSKIKRETALVPACLFNEPHIEDFECARALHEALLGIPDAAERAIRVLNQTNRIEEFLSKRPDTGKEDIEIVFDVNRFNIVPSAKITDGGAVVTLK